MKFTAVGDAIIGRRIEQNFPGYQELAPLLGTGDARFFNLETTLNREGTCPASQFSGGTYLRTDPRVLEDLEKFGFNLTSFNNNHAMDFSYEGLYQTLDALNESNLIHAGVGLNMAEAAAPRSSSSKPMRAAKGERRKSALSWRSNRRISARLVNIRYGSSVPRVMRSSIMTPI